MFLSFNPYPNELEIPAAELKKSIITDGLPTMGPARGGRNLAGVSSTPKEAQHASVCKIQKEFKPLLDIVVATISSRIWKEVCSDNTLGGFANEADVVHFVKNVLEDALQAAGMFDLLRVVPEVEVLRVRPGFMIVFINGRPIGAVEVKQPSRNAMLQDNILGEVFDQLMHLRSVFGVNTPFAILTSYDKWRICWLDDDASNKLAMQTEIEKKQPKAYETPLKSKKPISCDDEGDEVTESKTKQSSPPPPDTPSRRLEPRLHVPDTDDKPVDVDEDGDMTNASSSRKICVSRIVNSDDRQLVPMLVSVFRKMMQTAFTDVKHKAGKSVTRVLRYANATTHCWKKAYYPLGLQFQQPISFGVKNFFIWEELGHGAEGKAFLVSGGSQGNVGVAKFYFRHQGTNAASESQNWTNVYKPDRLPQVTSVRVIRLMGLEKEVLLMPWFATPKRDEKTLQAIQDTLKRDFQGNGFVHHDVAWRNVGTYHSKDGTLKAVLFDMSSVQQFRQRDTGWVINAITNLRKKLH
jgi:hypothetical protein